MVKGKFVIGTVLGAAAGVVAGMLTAPKSGQETRADLKAKAVELMEEAARRANRGEAEEGIADSLKKQAGRIIDMNQKPGNDNKSQTDDKQ
jgi:gas vesicle protein